MIPGAVTSSMGRIPTAAQDLLLPAQEHVSRWLLPTKPWGGVGSHASAKACIDCEG